MGLSKLERETGILWNEDETEVIVWTTSAVVRRRMVKIWGDDGVNQWRIPRSAVKLPRVSRRRTTEKQKEASRVRMAAIHSRRAAN